MFSKLLNMLTHHRWHAVVFAAITSWVLWSRFYGISWGLPYQMHPDERNMVVAIEQLRCVHLFDGMCLHPHFFAYGQLTLYTAYFCAHLARMLGIGAPSGMMGLPSLDQITLSLRFISACASVGVFVVLARIFLVFEPNPTKKSWFVALISFGCVPAFIQFSHFGTTESILMLAYVVLFYESVIFLRMKRGIDGFIVRSGIVYGLALGVKTSALIFGVVPVVALIYMYIRLYSKLHGVLVLLYSCIKLMSLTVVFYILSSPYNSIAWSDFLGSMAYESSVGLGTYRAFYTRQFEDAIPFIFQMTRILPYALGGPVFLLSLLGFLWSPHRRLYTFLRVQIILFCVPTMMIYAKWTRFVAPIFPLLVLSAVLLCVHFFQGKFNKFSQVVMTALCIAISFFIAIPGVAFMSIYSSDDVRTQASEWIYQNLSSRSQVLSETANVVDIPFQTAHISDSIVGTSGYHVESFGLYDVDENPSLQNDLESWLDRTDFIFIPSRRVFYNHTCFRPNKTTYTIKASLIGYDLQHCVKLYRTYPQLQTYYDRLFSGKAGFSEVARFTSYPRLEFFGRTLLMFPDEDAEETWTVFDHPVIRIWKKM